MPFQIRTINQADPPSPLSQLTKQEQALRKFLWAAQFCETVLKLIFK